MTVQKINASLGIEMSLYKTGSQNSIKFNSFKSIQTTKNKELKKSISSIDPSKSENLVTKITARFLCVFHKAPISFAISAKWFRVAKFLLNTQVFSQEELEEALS